MACLIFSSASAIFLLLMGLSLGVNFATMPWRISIGLSYTFSLYIVIALSLSLVTGALIISNVQITFTNQRLKDIGIMKAVGLVEETGSFLFSEAAITTIIGCLIGGVLGAAVNLVSIKVLNAFGYSFTFSLPIVPLLALFVIVVSISFASTYFPMSRMLHRLNAIEAISGNTAKRVGRKSFLEKASRSPYYKIALRSLTARRGETLRIIVTCILCMMLVSTMIFGGQTIDSTVSSYVKGGIGENVYLIANPKIAENYAELLSFYPSGVLSQGSSISWLNQGYGVNNSFIHWLEAQPFIETVDTRIVTTATAYEIKYVTIVQTDEGPSYETIG
ncbi:MAG TPA: FtsX-like permease family protein, partial [archaeon]|nr:FtsX-like permease family protein [archaeon]